MYEIYYDKDYIVCFLKKYEEVKKLYGTDTP